MYNVSCQFLQSDYVLILGSLWNNLSNIWGFIKYASLFLKQSVFFLLSFAPILNRYNQLSVHAQISALCTCLNTACFIFVEKLWHNSWLFDMLQHEQAHRFLSAVSSFLDLYWWEQTTIMRAFIFRTSLCILITLTLYDDSFDICRKPYRGWKTSLCDWNSTIFLSGCRTH